MRLAGFSVQGVRNLARLIEIPDLSPLEVVHGPNSVGKSNLLFAMRLFFVLLGTAKRDGFLPLSTGASVSRAELQEREVQLDDVFSYVAPFPIDMLADISVDPEELDRAGIKQLHDTSRVRIGLHVERDDQQDGLWVRVRRFEFGDGADAAAEQESAEAKARILKYARFLATGLLGTRLPLVDVDRRTTQLVDALYDASVSKQIDGARRWSRFREVMKAFQDVLGEGEFVVVLERGAEHAGLLYETSTARVPLHALGTGAQQLVALFAAMLTNDARMLLLEEPEVHLRWVLQERVRDALRDLVGKPGAPSQIILTSHSATFEVGTTFLYMHATPTGPVIERKPIAFAQAILGGAGAAPPLPKGAGAPTFVSTEGIMRVPERVLEGLDLIGGGAVSFGEVKDHAVVEMMTTDELLRRTDIGDDA